MYAYVFAFIINCQKYKKISKMLIKYPTSLSLQKDNALNCNVLFTFSSVAAVHGNYKSTRCL